MKFKFIEGWKEKFPKLWSVRLALLSAVLGVIEITLPLWQSLVPPLVFATLSTLAAVSAAVARIVAQPDLIK